MTTALVFCVPEGRAMLFIRRCYELPYKKFNSVCEIWVLLSKRILPLPEFHHVHIVRAANKECSLERKCLDEV